MQKMFLVNSEDSFILPNNSITHLGQLFSPVKDFAVMLLPMLFVAWLNYSPFKSTRQAIMHSFPSKRTTQATTVLSLFCLIGLTGQTFCENCHFIWGKSAKKQKQTCSRGIPNI